MKLRAHTRLLTCLLILVFFSSMPFFTGCGNKQPSEGDVRELLRQDAETALKSAYAEDFSRINIIKGAINKFVVNPENPRHLGTAIGAVEATVFPGQYELDRFKRLENLPAEMRKDIINQPMLSITLKKRETLNHTYNSVLKPLSDKLERGERVDSGDMSVLNEMIESLDRLAQAYSVLAEPDTDLKGSEAQTSFLAVQSSLREIQKLQLLKKE